MVRTDVLWEGNISLNDINWHITGNEYKLSSKDTLKRKLAWEKNLQKEPDIYDGSLLFVEDFTVDNTSLVLNVGTIRFSTLLTIKEYNLGYNYGYGVLGVQCLIYDQQRQFILIGRRRMDQNYCPGMWTVPGGMIEEKDSYQPPKVSLMREIHEEVQLTLTNESLLKAILVEHNNLSLILLFENSYSKWVDPVEKVVGLDNEWEGELKWLSLNFLNQLSSDELMEGLSYLKNKMFKKK